MDIIHNVCNFGFVCGNHKITTNRSFNYLEYPSKPDGWMNFCKNDYSRDQELVEYLQEEVYDKFGVEIIFYETSYNKKYDRIFGEDNNRHILNYWYVKSFFPLPKEEKTWSKFGIEGMNIFSMFVSKYAFKDRTNNYIPQIGDIVQTVFDNKIYEITEVKEETPTFFQSKRYTWEFVVRPFKIEQEISVIPSLSASPIAKYFKIDDIFDIRTDVDIEIDKDKIKYVPKPTEKPQNNPFGNW